VRRLVACVLCVALTACPSTPSVPPAVAPSPPKSVAPPAPAELTYEQAQKVVASIAVRRAVRKAELQNDPLGTPKSLEDVLEVLRRDQQEFFPGALAFAATQEGPKALALRAQIELAWGESELILEQMLTRTATRLREDLSRLEVKRRAGGLNPEETATLESLRETLTDLAGVSEALVRVGAEHVSAGATLAQQVIAAAPDDYQGYRVAADYFRVRGEWDRFDEMMAKLDATNPKSNGGLFLRGVEALQRKHDTATAELYFLQALEKDPKFARAQAQVALARAGRPEAQLELKRLADISPHHQLVRWMGAVAPLPAALDGGR